MFRFLLTLTGVLVMAISGFAADPKPGSVFGQEIRIPANTGYGLRGTNVKSGSGFGLAFRTSGSQDLNVSGNSRIPLPN